MCCQEQEAPSPNSLWQISESFLVFEMGENLKPLWNTVKPTATTPDGRSYKFFKNSGCRSEVSNQTEVINAINLRYCYNLFVLLIFLGHNYYVLVAYS